MNAEDAVLTKEMKGKRKRGEGTSNNHDRKKETECWANHREKEGTSNTSDYYDPKQ